MPRVKLSIADKKLTANDSLDPRYWGPAHSTGREYEWIDLEHREFMVKILVGELDINAVNGSGDNAVSLAARKGDLEILKKLVQMGGNCNHTNPNCNVWHNSTPLIWASRCGHLDVIRYLLERGVNMETTVEIDPDHIIGEKFIVATAMIWAAQNDAREIVQLLTSYGANYQYVYDNYPDLRSAIEAGKEDQKVLVLKQSQLLAMLKEKGLPTDIVSSEVGPKILYSTRSKTNRHFIKKSGDPELRFVSPRCGVI